MWVSFCFCGLHAHMRLTESLVKVIFGRAIPSKVNQLNTAFKEHLGVQEKFKKVQTVGKNKGGWQKVSFTGYECLNFSKTLKKTDTHVEESAIERVLHEVFPKHEEDLVAKARDDANADARPVRRRRERGKSNNITDPRKDDQFIHSFCCLWQLFHNVTKQMRCKDPSTPDLDKFGENCRDLGARWCILLPENRTTPFYLHTITMHGENL